MKTRKEKWLEKGYTNEQIENHLQFERYKSKQSRERRKKNNEDNKEIIKQIKQDLLNKHFQVRNKSFTITRISPTTDGKGFWFTYDAQFKDGSFGKFREFSYFDDYNFVEFIDNFLY